MNVAVLSVVYAESWWSETQKSLQRMQAAVDIYHVDRQGVGSLAEAFNRGFREHALQRYDYVWLITNVVFRPDVLPTLVEVITRKDWRAIHPAFKSDHAFLRKDSTLHGPGDVETPFIEFTAPLVHVPTFLSNPLDEAMPYIGHDLDWCYRVREQGGKVGVCRQVSVRHSYLRNLTAPESAVTLRRAELRRAAEQPTLDRLVEKYGASWRKKLYRSADV
jgi:GT2 family glycosyltransferase